MPRWRWSDGMWKGVIALLINVVVVFSLPFWYYLKNENSLFSRGGELKKMEAVKINLETPPKKKEKIKPRVEERSSKLELKNDSISERFQLDLNINSGAGVGASLGGAAGKNVIFSQNEVEVDPIRIGGRSPVVPPAFVDSGKQGKVDIEAVIDEAGNVISANSIQEDPPGYGLKETVLSSIKTWRFKPAMVNRIPVKVRVIIPFIF